MGNRDSLLPLMQSLKRAAIILFISAFQTIPQNIPFGHLSTENGLSNNAVNYILQDHLGFLWFATEDGLNRYDGYELKIYRNNPDDVNTISDNSIWSLYEDRSGSLWIGTNNGELNKYDYTTDKFSHWRIPSKNNRQSRITCIYEDKKGLLWIGTYKDGLFRFNLSTKSLDHWQHNPNNSKTLSYNYITSIVEDCYTNLWIGTYNGLNKFNPNLLEKPFTQFFKELNQNSLSSNLIWNLTRSNTDTNIIWISTANGLTKFNSALGVFSRINFQDSQNIQFGNSTGHVVEEVIENEKILWAATYGGLVRKNLSTGYTLRFTKENLNSYEICSNHINYCIKDKSNVLWLATDNGLSFLSFKNTKFNYFFPLSSQNGIEKLKNKNIKAITQSSRGSIWFGSEEGLFFTENFEKVIISSRVNLEKLNVWSLAPGNSEDIWIGTYGQGLKQLDIKSGKLKSLMLGDPSSKFKNQSFDFIKAILQDSKGILWVGFWGPGVSRLNPKTGEYQNWQNIENDPFSISYNDVWTIYQDSKERIWIGTNGGGLNLFQDINGGKFICWSKDKNPVIHRGSKKNTLSLSDNSIYSICETKNGKFGTDSKSTVLWIGTGRGLNKLRITNDNNSSNLSIPNIDSEIIYYTVKDGLPDNIVKSILEDENGNLWLGTNNGISFFNVQEKTFTNFTSSDGLTGNEFNSGSACQTSGGIMLYGSTKGLNFFDPKKIRQSNYSPPVLITGFQIFNQQITVNKNSPLKTGIPIAKEIALSYDQNVFSFQFSSLDYNSPSSIKYSYMMEGFDKDWIFSGSRRFATYTNLDPGNYIFKVKATNSDGLWNNSEASINIIINPPWWKTIWAYGLYSFLIAAGLISIRRFQINRLRLREELKLREFEAKKLQELENLKSRFFANLSHEFRTPLMLIKGPVEQLIKKWTGDNLKREGEFEQLKMVQRNSQKLQELIDQLLELSQLEAAAIPLKAKKENLTVLLSGIVLSFELHAKNKSIDLVFNNYKEVLFAWIDHDKFEKIMNNLLSNAFKFTSAGGRVTVSMNLNESSQQIEITISDTGIGIPDDQLEQIFNRFYQVDNSASKAFSGSGIGLALVKELVELHKWEILVKSEIGKGTEFSLTIPVGYEYLKECEKIFEETNEIEQFISEENYLNGKETGIDKDFYQYRKIETKPVKKSLILIVEDSIDVRKYLSGLLKPCYDLIEAENGESGLKTAVEKMPDLIISDIMMPYMDGIEFCRRVKVNLETSHIPIILLTAKASSESKIEGLETGADDYLTKPFNSKELFIRIKNLLEQRSLLREKFSREIKISADAATSIDSEFLKKAFNVAEKNLSNADFNSEAFAKEMFVSRSQLHRKLVALTALPPGEFLRSFRLKRAAQMLIEKSLNITQISFEVGFSSPSHFTKAFHQQFGCLPSEFCAKI